MQQDCESVKPNDSNKKFVKEHSFPNDTSGQLHNDEDEEISDSSKVSNVYHYEYKGKTYQVKECLSKSSSDVFSSERETSASSPDLVLSDVDQRKTFKHYYSHATKIQNYKELYNNESNSDTDTHNKEPTNWQAPEDADNYIHRLASLIEYYLSDENLAKDMFLLKHVTKNQGYISLKLISKYKKVKKICKDWRDVQIAVKISDKLELNEEETKVRRCDSIPHLESKSSYCRSVLAYDIPPNIVSIEKVAEIFGGFGEMNSIQIYKPGGKKHPNFQKLFQKYPHILKCASAIIEFERNQNACEAVKSLSDDISTPIKAMELPNFESVFQKPRYIRKRSENESSYYSASDIESEETCSPFFSYKGNPHDLTFSCCCSFPKPPVKECSALKNKGSFCNCVPNISNSAKYREFPDSSQNSMIHPKHLREQKRFPSSDLTTVNKTRKPFTSCTNTTTVHNTSLKNPFEMAKRRILHNVSSSCPTTPTTSPLPFRKSQKQITNISRLPLGPDGSKGFKNRCMHITK